VPSLLPRPNHDLVQIAIAGVTGSNGEPIALTITGITQDEPIDGIGDGRTCPDAAGVGTETAAVRAERSGMGDGRVYHIGFQAEADRHSSCEGSVTVCVPVGASHSCANQGALFDSTGPLCMSPCGQLCFTEMSTAGVACDAERVPMNVRLRLHAARRALRGALRSRTLVHASRLVTRARKLFGVAEHLTRDAETAGRISHACAVRVLDALTQSDASARLWADGVSGSPTAEGRGRQAPSTP
jgi:hypothetical protein